MARDDKKGELNPNQFTLFHKTKPWGYHPVEVEDKIQEYEQVLRTLNERLEAMQIASNDDQSRIARLERELRDLHRQLATVDVRETSPKIAQRVLTDFKNFHADSPQSPFDESILKQYKSNEPPTDEDPSDEGFTIIT